MSAERMPVRLFSVADGLAGDAVTALLPDSRGFLWIGTTTGLSRFDGVDFRNFGVESGLGEAQVRDVAETPEGDLWVLTRRSLARLAVGGTRGEHPFALIEVEDGAEIGLSAALHVDAGERSGSALTSGSIASIAPLILRSCGPSPCHSRTRTTGLPH